MDNLIDAGLGSRPDRAEVNFGGVRRLIVTINAREVLQFSTPCLGIQPLHIPALTFLQRRIHVNFEELARVEQAASQLALGSEW